MFTGIIEATAAVREKHATGLIVERPTSFEDVRPGSSVCVSGACLTITAMDDTTLSFDVVPETWSKTMLGALQPGSRVNLERAMRADGRFDGHVVQGHVEGTAKVSSFQFPVSNDKMDALLSIELPPELTQYVIPKGSITVDGVSLTVASLTPAGCRLALIPTTLRETTLGTLRAGDAVNLETDMFVRTISALHHRL